MTSAHQIGECVQDAPRLGCEVKAISMEKGVFQTSSGRTVRLDAVHVQKFDRYYLEGRADIIRSEVLADLPNEVRRVFPGQSGILVTRCEESANCFPRLIMMCEFSSTQPVGGDADCSSLVVVWFVEHWEFSNSDFVSARVGSIDWEQHAVDGWY